MQYQGLPDSRSGVAELFHNSYNCFDGEQLVAPFSPEGLIEDIGQHPLMIPRLSMILSERDAQ